MKRKMAFEWNWPTVCWHWPSFVIFEIDFHFNRKGDHSPGVGLLVMILGVKLIDCGYYNVFHEDEG